MSGDVFNITITNEDAPINVSAVNPPPIFVNFSEVAIPDPSVAQARTDAENAAIAAESAKNAAQVAQQAAEDAVAGIGSVVATEVTNQLATKTSDDFSEGTTNLFWTNARFDTRLATKSTDDLAQGATNKYYSGALFDSSFSGKTTSDLSEGTNLYWTGARFDTAFSGKTTADLTENTNLYFTNSRAKTAAVVNSTSGSETDQAASVAAMKTYVTNNAGGSGGSLSWEKIGDISPTNESQDGIKLEAFDYQDEQEIYLTLNVPDNYQTGNQIKLKNGAFFLGVNTNKVLFRTVTALIRPGTTVLGTYSNTHTSTNSEVSANGTPNTLTAIGDLDLTNSSGQINGVAVAANDKLRVKLSRKVASESVSATDKAKLMINNFDVTFR